MEEKILGQWGRMRRAYLMEHRPATFSTMVMRGELFPHLYQVDEQAELILAQMLEHDPGTPCAIVRLSQTKARCTNERCIGLVPYSTANQFFPCCCFFFNPSLSLSVFFRMME